MSKHQPTDTRGTYGPQTDEIIFLIDELLPTLTPTQASQIEGWHPLNAALALILRDVLDRDVYRLLAGPVADVFGPLHPDDVADEEE